MPTEVYTEPGLRVLWVPRSEWGSLASTETYIANRVKVSLTARTEMFVHHTASVDGSDTTPNTWDYDDARNYMRALQWVRPDLGPLPYPENIAVAEDGETVWLFEGRGFTAKPAHATNHNTTGYAVGIFGNFDILESYAGIHRALRAVRWRAWDLRTNHGFTNLGNDKNPNGWDLWGHRDDSTKSCPGDHLYPLLAEYPFVDWSPTPMATYPIKRENAAAPDGDGSRGSDVAKECALIRNGWGVGTDVAPGTGAWPQALVDFLKTELAHPTGLAITGNMSGLIDIRSGQASGGGGTGPYLTMEAFEEYAAEVAAEVAALEAFDDKVRAL